MRRNGATIAIALAALVGCGDTGSKPGDAAKPAPAANAPAATANAAAPAPSPPRELAWIDGEPLDADSVGPLATDAGPEAQANAVRGAIDRRLAAEEAKRRGLDQTPWVREALARAHADARRAEEEILADALAESLVGADAATEAALREAFEADPSRFARPRYGLRLSTYGTRDAAEAAARTLAEQGFLADTRFEDLGPAFAWELPPWLRGQIGALDAPGRRIVVERPDGFVLVEVASLELAPPISFEAARDDVMRVERRGLGAAALMRELERLRAERKIRTVDEAR